MNEFILKVNDRQALLIIESLRDRGNALAAELHGLAEAINGDCQNQIMAQSCTTPKGKPSKKRGG